MTTAQTAPGLGFSYANEVSAGWPSLYGAACDWKLAVGEGLGMDDSWDPVSLEQAGRREGGKIRTVERKTG